MTISEMILFNDPSNIFSSINRIEFVRILYFSMNMVLMK